MRGALTGTHKIRSMDACGPGTGHKHAERLDLAIIERSTGTWLGEVALMDLDEVNRSRNVRIALVRRALARDVDPRTPRVPLTCEP